MQQPAWLAHAWAELGQREVGGAADNPRILKYYEDVGFGEIHHDEVAWCAAFAGACLERSGIASTRLLLARSYLQFGEAIETGRAGAIVILSRGSDPALGHVGFWLGETDGRVFLLGGNQGDAVSVQGFDKARLLGMRWPREAAIPPPQAAAPAQSGTPSDPLFQRALAHVLEMEGGYTDDPHDPGGPTNQGITLATYASWHGERLDGASRVRLVAALKSIDADSVRRIYRQRYWRPSRAAELPAALALMHFDAAVNHGVTGAARMLQEALDVTVDGEIGPETLDAAAEQRPADVIASYAVIRRARYRALPHFWRFGGGWLARVLKTERLALATPGADDVPATGMGADQQGDPSMSETASGSTLQSKWWGESMTVWGVIITTLSTVLPVIGPFVGLDISGEMIRQIGAQATQVFQALAGLVGTVLTLYGRARATAPLMRRDVRIRL